MKDDKLAYSSYEDIVEGLTEGVVAVDLRLRVTVFNQAAEKMSGISRSVARSRTVAELFGPSAAVAVTLEKTLTEGKLYSGHEEKLNRRFAGEIPVGITTSRVFDADGELTGAAALIKDLSGLKTLEAGALQKERLATLGSFAAHIAHEIRNPLSGIRGAAQLLGRKAADPRFRDYTDLIVRETDRLSAMLNGMLEFSRPARLSTAPVNIHMVLDSCLLLLGEGPGREAAVRKEYDPSLPPVNGDRDKLTQVFLNLIKNADEAVAAAAAEGAKRERAGSISIVTRMITDFHLLAPGAPGGGKMILVEVRDTGCGMTKETLDGIFTPFFTTKPAGSGLGMPVSLKIIREHGGHIKVDSAPGSGTTVAVYLPASDGRGVE